MEAEEWLIKGAVAPLEEIADKIEQNSVLINALVAYHIANDMTIPPAPSTLYNEEIFALAQDYMLSVTKQIEKVVPQQELNSLEAQLNHLNEQYAQDSAKASVQAARKDSDQQYLDAMNVTKGESQAESITPLVSAYRTHQKYQAEETIVNHLLRNRLGISELEERIKSKHDKNEHYKQNAMRTAHQAADLLSAYQIIQQSYFHDLLEGFSESFECTNDSQAPEIGLLIQDAVTELADQEKL